MRWKAIAVVAFITVIATSTPATALTILGTLRTTTNGPDGNPTFGGGNIEDIFAAAAGFWEGAILDDEIVPIEYGWTPGGGPLAFAIGDGRSGRIFVPVAHDFFLDLTPDQNEEYTTPVTSFLTIDGQQVNYGVGFTGGFGGADGFDLLTILIHEIGHVLGSAPSHFDDSLGEGDGDVDIDAHLPLAGIALPTFNDGCCHLDVPQDYTGLHPSLWPFIDIRERRFISGADLLFVADGGGWKQVDQSRFAAAPEPSTLALLAAGVTCLRFRRRRTRKLPAARRTDHPALRS